MREARSRLGFSFGGRGGIEGLSAELDAAREVDMLAEVAKQVSRAACDVAGCWCPHPRRAGEAARRAAEPRLDAGVKRLSRRLSREARPSSQTALQTSRGARIKSAPRRARVAPARLAVTTSRARRGTVTRQGML